MSDHKLGIIVPYRNRKQHLRRFVQHMDKYLNDIEYEIYVIEQNDDKPFNRGKLLNIGFDIARETCDYIAFHDVDMLPEDADYSYPNVPIHLATNLSINDYKLAAPDYFGGVTLFKIEDFENINGYSNNYWGWGFEDDDLLNRCKTHGLPLDRKWYGDPDQKISQVGYFNGFDSHIKIPFNHDIFGNSVTIGVRAKPENVVLNPNNEYDEYFMVSKPGFNTGISYNSFKQFKSEIWLDDGTSKSITTTLLNEIWVQLIMVIDLQNFEMTFYMNGELIGTEKFYNQIFNYDNNNLYLGVGNKDSINPLYFKGYMAEFFIINGAADQEGARKLFTDSLVHSLTSLGSNRDLECYYDFNHVTSEGRLMDYSGKDNHGMFHHIRGRNLNDSFGSNIVVPYNRPSRFNCMLHKNNSWNDLKWVHPETRKNQLKFSEKTDSNIDGLNTLNYKIVARKNLEYTHVEVDI